VIDWLSPDILLPELHAALGALAVAAAYALAPGRIGEPDRPHRAVPRGIVGAFVLLVLLKETLWDPANEAGQPFLWSGATDLGWYLVGIGAMLGALAARYRRL
jgi:hypothetical protein